MPKGGKRAGSGAPKGNQHTAKHGLYSKSISDPATLESFKRIYRALQDDPKSALLASAALIFAHVERVIRQQDADGFYQYEVADSTGEKGCTVTKRAEITVPLARAIRMGHDAVAVAYEVGNAHKTVGNAGTVEIHLHSDLTEE